MTAAITALGSAQAVQLVDVSCHMGDRPIIEELSLQVDLATLFGLTGSRAPTALIDLDGTAYSRDFVTHLEAAHHSFALRRMDAAAASAALHRGELVAMITIPCGFGRAVARGRTIALPVTVDNVDVDFTEDIQRALPSAIVSFAQEHHFAAVRLRPVELDLLDHDTGFIPYLVVSGLALDALVVSGILAAVAVAREFEAGTVPLLAVAPVHPLAPLAGRISTTSLVAFLAMLMTAAVVVVGYGVSPVHPVEMIAALASAVVIFGCVGAMLGAALRRTLPVTSLVFGLALPLYIDSGALEPERFDGDLIWGLAHLSPVYYAVGLLEHAVHGFRVTPEPIVLDLLALFGWAILALVAGRLLGGLLAALSVLVPALVLCSLAGLIAPPAGHWPALAALFVATGLCASGLGAALGSVVRRARAVAMASSILATYLFFLGGGFTTIAFLPAWLRQVSAFVPIRYAIDGLRQCLFYPGLEGVATDLTVLGATTLGALCVGALAVRRSWSH